MGDDLKAKRESLQLPCDQILLRVLVLHELHTLLQSYGMQLGTAADGNAADGSTVNIAFTDEEQQTARDANRCLYTAAMPKIFRDETVPESERDALRQEAEMFRRELKPSQKLLVDAVLHAVQSGTSLCAFVDAPGGTGKTYCFNTMLKHVRADGKIALAVASSGIAATLLDLGRTFHSRFRPPWVPTEGEFLSIKAQETVADLIRDAQLIFWDEAPMVHRFQLEALDRTLRDFMEPIDKEAAQKPFGGKVVVLAGGQCFHYMPCVSFALL